MAKNRVITVQGIPVTVSYEDIDDFICITDIAAAKSDNSRAADVIRNWLRNRSTLEFLSTWEEIYNPNFKVFESEHFKKEAGLVTFTPSVSEWVEKTNAVGLYVKRGKYGGTFAHKDIAFEFASAISPVFKLYLIKEFQRLKEAENDLQKLEWDAKRFLSKNNYLIQTDAVKNYLIPVCNYREDLQWLPYAEEADLHNLDVTDSMYEKKYDDLQKRFYDKYDEMALTENHMDEIQSRLAHIRRKQLSGDRIYNFLIAFDKLYDKLSDAEKKEFMGTFVESIELYPERLENGKFLKHIHFRFPVYYNGTVIDDISWENESTVESVVLLSRV